MQNDVLFSMLMSLLAQPQTAQKLSVRHELSIRSVYRYLDTLECAGVPLMRKNGCKGGFYIDSAHFIDKAYFSDEEYKLLLGLTEGAALGGKIAADVADKIAALARMHGAERYRLSPDTLVIDADSWTGTGHDTVSELQRAIESRTALEIEYLDGKDIRSVRLIEPHTLVLKAGLWYVYAYCTVRSDWRLFAANRILRWTEKDIFKRRIYDLAAVPWRTLPVSENNELTLRCDNITAALLADRYPLTRQEDGTLTIYAPQTKTLVAEIIKLGSSVTVLAPVELRDAVIAELSASLKNYQE